jgi:pentatricopeptide repeat protein
MAERLQKAIESRRVEDAWPTYVQLKKLVGFPTRLILNRLIIVSSYSENSKWLKKAYTLVFTVLKERKWELLGRDALTLLCVGLARAQMPVDASTILRIMVEKHEFPPVGMWKLVIAHMVKSETGTFLAPELLIEFCSLIKEAKPGNRRVFAMRPDATAFNIVLKACLEFGNIRKAKKILEFMPGAGVKPDATCFMLMVQVYEKNGCRDELKELKRKIGKDPRMLEDQYRQFYSSLMACHFKFGDVDAASELILDMLRSARLKHSHLDAGKHGPETANDITKNNFEAVRPTSGAANKVSKNNPVEMQDIFETDGDKLCKRSADQVGFGNSSKLHKYSKVHIEPAKLQNNFAVEVMSNECLVNYKDEMPIPNEKIYAKLAKGYLQSNRSEELARFLIRVDRERGPVLAEESACSQIIDACIELGWLDYAHDMLDEMNSDAVPVWVGLYSSLLKAYCKARCPREIAAILREIRKAGLQLDISCYEEMVEAGVAKKDLRNAKDLFGEAGKTKSTTLMNGDPTLKIGFAKSSKLNLKTLFLEEVKEDQHIAPGIYAMNSAIHFFCKGHLMDDAEKALKKMKKLGPQPNSQTFESLIDGYSAEGNYREITIFWGDMKRMVSASAESGGDVIELDRELHDTLLCSFLRGGYFERSLEVITRMEQQNMFIDKWKYRQLYSKFHKDLYRHTIAPEEQTEAQVKRIQHVLAFKKWAGKV